MTGPGVLDDNGDTLAHVTEQLVIETHFVHGHGPEPWERCPLALCVTWRRYLRSRLP